MRTLPTAGNGQKPGQQLYGHCRRQGGETVGLDAQGTQPILRYQVRGSALGPLRDGGISRPGPLSELHQLGCPETELGQCRHGHPPADPLVMAIAIAWIDDRRQTGCGDDRLQLVATKAEEWPEDLDATKFRKRHHPAQASRPLPWASRISTVSA